MNTEFTIYHFLLPKRKKRFGLNYIREGVKELHFLNNYFCTSVIQKIMTYILEVNIKLLFSFSKSVNVFLEKVPFSPTFSREAKVMGRLTKKNIAA